MRPLPETLVWECPWCGLETPQPEEHLRRAHGVPIEKLMAWKDELEKRRKGFERLLLMAAEMGEHRVCPMCGCGGHR